MQSWPGPVGGDEKRYMKDERATHGGGCGVGEDVYKHHLEGRKRTIVTLEA